METMIKEIVVVHFIALFQHMPAMSLKLNEKTTLRLMGFLAKS
jgi:hypothetical protein